MKHLALVQKMTPTERIIARYFALEAAYAREEERLDEEAAREEAEALTNHPVCRCGHTDDQHGHYYDDQGQDTRCFAFPCSCRAFRRRAGEKAEAEGAGRLIVEVR